MRTNNIRTYLVFSLMSFTNGVSMFVFSGILDTLVIDLNITLAQAGMLSSSYAIGALFGGPLVLIAFSKLNRKHLLVGSLAIGILMMFGLTQARSFTIILVFRGLMGISLSAFTVLAVATVIAISDPQKRGQAMAYMPMGLSLSLIIGIPVARLLITYFPWQVIFYGLIVLAIFNCLYFAFKLPKSNHKDHYISLKNQLTYLKSKKVIVALIITIVMFVGYSALYVYITPYLIQYDSFKPYISLILIIVGLFALIGNHFGGRALDKLGGEKALIWGSIIYLIGSILLMFTRSFAMLNLISFLIFVFALWMLGLMTNYSIVHYTHQNANVILAINGSAIQLGYVIGPSSAGYIISHFGLNQIVLISLISAILLMIFSLYLTKVKA